MGKNVLFAALTAALFLLSKKGVAQVSSSFDSGANFGKYVTYSFLGWQKQSNESISMEDQQIILNALEDEFSKRGVTRLTKGGSAIVLLYVVVDEKTAATDYMDHLKQYGYGTPEAEDTSAENDTMIAHLEEVHYKQGSLIVNMHDAETQKLVWRGVVTDVIQKSKIRREETIPQHIKELMNTYPVVR